MSGTPPRDLTVLVVEDEPVAAEAHGAYVERTSGFTLAGTARTGREAMRLAGALAVDLVLLDLHLPDVHGLDLWPALRVRGGGCDVMAVTSARDLDAVRAAVATGVVGYVLKPFTYRALADKLERYREYRGALAAGGPASGQGQVDAVLATLRGRGATSLPSGLAEETLAAVTAVLQRSAGRVDAEGVAAACGASRVTARRYLEHLVEVGLADRSLGYGGPGRPRVGYAWAGRPRGVRRPPGPPAPTAPLPWRG